MMARLHEPIGDPAELVFLVTDENGALYVAYDPSEPFDSLEPNGCWVCLSEAEDTVAGLHELRAAVDRAIAQLAVRS